VLVPIFSATLVRNIFCSGKCLANQAGDRALTYVDVSVATVTKNVCTSIMVIKNHPILNLMNIRSAVQLILSLRLALRVQKDGQKDLTGALQGKNDA
jgi:hypothetical protein